MSYVGLAVPSWKGYIVLNQNTNYLEEVCSLLCSISKDFPSSSLFIGTYSLFLTLMKWKLLKLSLVPNFEHFYSNRKPLWKPWKPHISKSKIISIQTWLLEGKKNWNNNNTSNAKTRMTSYQENNMLKLNFYWKGNYICNLSQSKVWFSHNLCCTCQSWQWKAYLYERKEGKL